MYSLKGVLGILLDETLLTLLSIMGVSHVFMMFLNNKYEDDTQKLEEEKAKDDLVGYRELLENKRELLNNVLDELNVLGGKLEEITEMVVSKKLH